MRNDFKRLLSLAVAVIMIMTMLPASADCVEVSTMTTPDATVSVLDPITLTAAEHDYTVWPSGDDTIDRPLEIVMNFKANDTVDECLAGGYSEWLTDFNITLTGLENGSITADNCYLAGNYGTFGWIVIPTDDMELEDGVSYPVVAAYDATLNYHDICSSVKDFTAAVHIDQAILDANPNMTVTLELKMTNPNDATDVMLIGEPAVYDVEALSNGAAAQNVETGELYATVASGLKEAVSGQTVKLLRNVTEEEVYVRKGRTLDLNGFTLTATDVTVPYASSHIVDNTEGDGLLVVDPDNVAIKGTNTQLFVQTEDGYRFATVEFGQSAKLLQDAEGNDYAYYRFYIKGDDADCLLAQELADGADDNSVSIEVKLTWTDVNGSESYRYFVFSDELVEQYASDWLGNEFRLSVTGLDSITELKLAATVVSSINESTEVVIEAAEPKTVNP